MLRHKNDGDVEVIEAGEYSAFSCRVAELSRNLSESGRRLSLTFFCGASENFDASIVEILRSFCSQLLMAERLKFDVESVISEQTQLDALGNGNLNELEKLFEHLLFAAAKSYNAVVCFIDGVHVVERFNDGFRLFSKDFQFFEQLTNRIQKDKTITFKVLLTLPQQSYERWDQLTSAIIGIPTVRRK